jgi:hypothetical protein
MSTESRINYSRAECALLAAALDDAIRALEVCSAPKYRLGSRYYGRQTLKRIQQIRFTAGEPYLRLIHAARVIATFGLVGNEMDEALIALRQSIAEIDKDRADGA